MFTRFEQFEETLKWMRVFVVMFTSTKRQTAMCFIIITSIRIGDDSMTNIRRTSILKSTCLVSFCVRAVFTGSVGWVTLFSCIYSKWEEERVWGVVIRLPWLLYFATDCRTTQRQREDQRQPSSRPKRRRRRLWNQEDQEGDEQKKKKKKVFLLISLFWGWLSPNLMQVQSFLRGWICRRKWKTIIQDYIRSPHAESMRKRNQVVFSMLDSEAEYVQQLHILVNNFLRPLRMAASSKKPPITHDDVSSIFLNRFAMAPNINYLT